MGVSGGAEPCRRVVSGGTDQLHEPRGGVDDEPLGTAQPQVGVQERDFHHSQIPSQPLGTISPVHCKMSRKRALQVVLPCESAEAFAAAVKESEKKLVVFDIHQGWCGPCTTVEPVFRKAYMELENPESRLRIYAVSVLASVRVLEPAQPPQRSPPPSSRRSRSQH